MITYPILEQFDEITHFCTTRHGGVSQGNYASFNISPFSGDSIDYQTENFNRLAQVINLPTENIVFPYQTHGSEVIIIDGDFLKKNSYNKNQLLSGKDALVTNLPEICIGITTADCVPLTFYDPIRKVTAVAHAGWRGTCKNIVRNTINVMLEHYECKVDDIYVVIGPSISVEAYQVGEELYENFESAGFPVSDIFKTIDSSLHLDLWKANQWLLLQAGIPATQIYISGLCTYFNNEEFFSARKLGIKSGRMLSGICIRN